MLGVGGVYSAAAPRVHAPHVSVVPPSGHLVVCVHAGNQDSKDVFKFFSGILGGQHLLRREDIAATTPRRRLFGRHPSRGGGGRCKFAPNLGTASSLTPRGVCFCICPKKRACQNAKPESNYVCQDGAKDGNTNTDIVARRGVHAHMCCPEAISRRSNRQVAQASIRNYGSCSRAAIICLESSNSAGYQMQSHL